MHIDVTPSNANIDVETTPGETQLKFTTSNWDEPQSVTVTANDDVIAEGKHYTQIRHSIASEADLQNLYGISLDDVAKGIFAAITADTNNGYAIEYIPSGSSATPDQLEVTSDTAFSATFEVPFGNATINPSSVAAYSGAATFSLTTPDGADGDTEPLAIGTRWSITIGDNQYPMLVENTNTEDSVTESPSLETLAAAESKLIDDINSSGIQVTGAVNADDVWKLTLQTLSATNVFTATPALLSAEAIAESFVTQINAVIPDSASQNDNDPTMINVTMDSCPQMTLTVDSVCLLYTSDAADE